MTQLLEGLFGLRRFQIENALPVESLSDGRVEAVAKALSSAPVFIRMNVMMPYVDGFEAIRQLKANDSTRDIPVIMLTAKRHDADLIHGLSSGAASYLTKPFNPTELVVLVERVLEESENGA